VLFTKSSTKSHKSTPHPDTTSPARRKRPINTMHSTTHTLPSSIEPLARHPHIAQHNMTPVPIYTALSEGPLPRFRLAIRTHSTLRNPPARLRNSTRGGRTTQHTALPRRPCTVSHLTPSVTNCGVSWPIRPPFRPCHSRHGPSWRRARSRVRSSR
jgi:hypothetical protein